MPRFQAFTLEEGPQAAHADEVAIDAATADQQGLEARRQGLRRRDRAAQVPTRSSGTTQIAGVELVRRRRGRSTSRCPRPSACSARAAASTRSRSPPSPASRRSSSRRSCASTLGRDGRRAHRAGAGRQAVQGHPRQPRLPEDRAAGVRRHLAVRRRLHDLQHLLDHRRAADARVRAAAHARRVARARSGARCSARGSMLGLRRRLVGLAPGHRGRRRACARCSRPSASTCPASGAVVETRTVDRVAPRGHGRDAWSPAWRRRCAPRACRRWRRCARAPCRRRAGAAADGHRSPALLLAIGVALMCVGLFGSLKSDSAAISFMGGGAALTFLGVALLSPRLVRPLALASSGARSSAPTGITGRLARENTVAPARAHRGHRRGADDRRRARDLRVDLRGRARRRRSTAPSTTTSRARSSCRTPTASRRSRPRCCAASPRRRRLERQRRALLAGQGPRRERQRSRSPAIDPRDLPDLYKLDMKEGGEAAVRGLGRGDVHGQEGLRRLARRQGRRHAAGDDAERQAHRPEGRAGSSTTRAACWAT